MDQLVDTARLGGSIVSIRSRSSIPSSICSRSASDCAPAQSRHNKLSHITTQLLCQRKLVVTAELDTDLGLQRLILFCEQFSQLFFHLADFQHPSFGKYLHQQHQQQHARHGCLLRLRGQVQCVADQMGPNDLTVATSQPNVVYRCSESNLSEHSATAICRRLRVPAVGRNSAIELTVHVFNDLCSTQYISCSTDFSVHRHAFTFCSDSELHWSRAWGVERGRPPATSGVPAR